MDPHPKYGADEHGRSLDAPALDALPANHYQNNLIPRERACFICHTEYTMYGNLKAKVQGLRHMYVHYVQGDPETLQLYGPYSNRECLQCHGTARKFLESMHGDLIEELRSDEVSCLGCHDVVHELESSSGSDGAGNGKQKD